MPRRPRKRHHIEPLERRRLLAVASAGTVLMDDILTWAGRADGATVSGNTIYFARYQSDSQTRVEIWKSDGTADGTLKLLTTQARRR